MNKSGQSFFELLVAVAIVSITLIALVSLATKSVSNSTYSRDKTLSTRYTQEALEWLRGERDKDWNSFYSKATGGSGSTYCMSDVGAGLQTGSCPMIPDTTFTRTITLISPGINSVEAIVTTSWEGDTGLHDTTISTVFTDWD
ncbi:MAG: hypothetical protein UV74_C0013G0165 [Candidatus Woesebacteria bacterium GW2011_GWB1_43_14]|uniref:Uncharacterized protein n=1 Tax=Candidatus Woesebacteria bacterium GW2011_GWB1_43_14 TaxID=1618578 RepID=A0A0G1GDU7_9BACT|nr:MAG: hypothetical protein UV51_C0005G0056 [Candidatus Woesebacteria bacterium GW2011_GWC1_42_9]KKS97043.1 MAG: hypothetical protein UV74_C0013G0165 [Candidatus Woesebacteria bacterium GW2011_GWB1_43_14]